MAYADAGPQESDNRKKMEEGIKARFRLAEQFASQITRLLGMPKNRFKIQVLAALKTLSWQAATNLNARNKMLERYWPRSSQ